MLIHHFLIEEVFMSDLPPVHGQVDPKSRHGQPDAEAYRNFGELGHTE